VHKTFVKKFKSGRKRCHSPISGTNAKAVVLVFQQSSEMITAASIPCSLKAPDVWPEGVFDLTKMCPSQAKLLVVDWTEGLDDVFIQFLLSETF